MNLNFNIKLFLYLLSTSLLLAFPIDKNIDIDEKIHKVLLSTESRVIVGEGASVIVGAKSSAKLWYDNIILLSNAKFIEDDDINAEKSQSKNNDNGNEMTQAIEASLPTELSISKAYPNPFNPVVNIRYGLPTSAAVNILIYDLIGRKIAEYSINQQSAGWHEFNWDAVDQYGQSVGSGIYLMTIQAGNMVKKQKITFLK